MSKLHRPRARVALPALVICAFAGLLGSSARAAAPTIGFHFIGAGGQALKNSCVRLSGTTGQAAPGYSSSAQYSVVAGFWSPAPTTSVDELFFDGFEDC